MRTSSSIPKFGGYHRRLANEEDRELTHVGQGTPAGEYLRRFWHPIALASELKDTAVVVKLLGEELVLFRDRSGRLGLLHKHCSHRGTSLEYGIISDQGIRCCYHGWLYDIDGTVIETPSEPATSRRRETVVHGAYRTHEYGGLIFAFMGPSDECPPFPIYDTFVWPEDNRSIPYKLFVPCNWLQVHENAADPIHTAYLHAIVSGIQFSPAFGALPVLDFFETPLGLLSVATRRCGENFWIRASDMILPNIAQFGTGFVDGDREKFALSAWLTRWIVPVDDKSCWSIGLRHFNRVIDPLNQGQEDMIGLGKVDFMGQTDERPYEDRQKSPGDWDAFVGQGGIAIHDNENLGATDKGVVMVRHQIRHGIRAIQKGIPLTMPRQYEAGVVPTYNNEVVLNVSVTGDDEQKLLHAFGRGVSQIVFETAELPPGRRHVDAERRVRR